MSKYLLDKNVQIYTKKSKTSTINIFNNELKNIEVSSITKHMLSAKINNKYVNLNAESLKDDKKLYKKLEELSLYTENSDESSFAKESITSDIKIELNNNKVVSNMLLSLYDKYKKLYDDLYVLNIYYVENYNEHILENKEIHSSDKTINYNMYAEIIMKHNNETYDGTVSIINSIYDKEHFDKKINERILEIISRYTKKEIKNDIYTAVLENKVVSKILNEFLGMYSAKNIKLGLSVLSDKFEKKVFNEQITIIEDPTNNLYPGKRIFDTEGSKTQYKEIVKTGVFVKKLYDNQSSKLENTTSTGNSFGVKNLYIKPSLDKIKLSDGILITNVEGTHAGINSLSGEISLQAQGYIIENNKKTYINSMIISTDIFKLLNSVEQVGNDLEFYSESLGTPSLLINNLHIIGTKKE